MSMMHSQINRAINTAIAERFIPEIQNILSSMSSSGNRDTEASVSPNSQKSKECSSGSKSKFTKKDSWSVCDLRDTRGRGHYNILLRFTTITSQHTLKFNLSRDWMGNGQGQGKSLHLMVARKVNTNLKKGQLISSDNLYQPKQDENVQSRRHI